MCDKYSCSHLGSLNSIGQPEKIANFKLSDRIACYGLDAFGGEAMAMSDSQKNASAVIAFAFLLFVSCWLLGLVLSHKPESMQSIDSDGFGSLTLLWSSFRWMVDQGEFVQKTFAGLLGIVGIGASFLANAQWFRGQRIVTSTICLAGILCCTILLVVFWDMNGDVFRTFDDNSDRSNEQLRTAIAIFIAAVVAWYVGFLEVQLGIRKVVAAAIKRK